MNEEDIHKNNFDGEKKKDDFSLPEGYFESFSARLFQKIHDSDEWKDFPVLARFSKTNPFILPPFYFENKEEQAAYPLLFQYKQNNLNAPVNYFDVLPEKITDRILLEEEKAQFASLYALRKTSSFAVPAQYFNSFTVKKEARIIALYKGIKISYKVAAALFLFLCLGILLIPTKKTNAVISDCQTFACLDKQEILNSGYVLRTSDESIIDLIDENSLSDSLLLKKNGTTQKVKVEDVAENIDINTLTD
ncbi:MAG: hypothetical protein JST67_05580 [Bacteroidetes bacterium]|nr:hypothetical protein [Bacteroidota bacterium]